MLLDLSAEKETAKCLLTFHAKNNKKMYYNLAKKSKVNSEISSLNNDSHNHDDQRHNLVKFIQRCRENGNFLKAHHYF